MKADDPRHGTYAGWQAHRKASERTCEPCRAAQAAYHKRMKYRLHTVGPSRIELGEPAWKVIDSMGRRELARLTGLRDSFLSRLHGTGPTTAVHRRTRDRLLAARPPATAVGIQRRLRALFALGYSGSALSREVGISVDAMRQLLASPTPRKYHHERTTQAVLDTYDRLAYVPMPTGSAAVAARNRARDRNWATPMAWDDIDNPNEMPGTTEPERPTMGRPSILPEQINDFDWLLKQGETEHSAAARIGVRLDSFKDQRRRHERAS